MKKFIIFFASLFLLTIVSCKEDEPVKQKIVGTWKPVKMVETNVTNNTSVSDTYIYSTCQQESRWVFKEDNSGSVWMRDDTYVVCHTKFESNLTYQYNDKTGEIVIKYLSNQDKGKISDLTENGMNLKIEYLDTDTGVYNSKTYTLVRVK